MIATPAHTVIAVVEGAFQAHEFSRIDLEGGGGRVQVGIELGRALGRCFDLDYGLADSRYRRELWLDHRHFHFGNDDGRGLGQQTGFGQGKHLSYWHFITIVKRDGSHEGNLGKIKTI